MNGNSYTNGSGRDYEVVEDIDDVDSGKVLAAKRRTSSRQMSVNANLMNGVTGTSGSYKTTEASHYGTITTRASSGTRKAKNSVPVLNAQNTFFDNDL
jgi:hypothetical protein